MTFRINEISRGHTEVHLLDGPSDDRDNRITLLVGPNGSGKTQVLVDMLTTHLRRRRGKSTWQEHVSFASAGAPSRVIAQTFSPFSRFPKERTSPPTLKEYLDPSPDPYAAVGLTRHNGIGRPIAREVAGRILRRLNSDPDVAPSFSVALESMGFAPRLKLVYIRSPLAQDVEFDGDRSGLRQTIKEFLERVQGKRRTASQELPILRELTDEKLSESEAIDRLVDLLLEAAFRVRDHQEIQYGSRRSQYVLDIDMHEEPGRMSRLPLESFLILSRMGFLRIGNCYLEPMNRGNSPSQFATAEGLPFDITDASSGQQQTLSSLFGIAAEIEDSALLLIDEPELSLHPAWQSSYLDNLKGILASREGCDVFIATHSPLVAQRGRELGLQLIDLGGRDAGNITPRAGASVDQVLLEDFKVPVRDSTYVAHLLLSLVMKAERRAELGQDVGAFLERLQHLQQLYGKAAMRDSKLEKLIRDAIGIVSSATIQKTEGSKSND